MTNYRQVAPRIRWGSTMQNALDIGYPLDVVTSWSAKREGSIDVQAPSGVEESWTVGTDYLLKGDARWIPQADLVGSPKQTGWDGAAGWRAFLEWARDKNLFFFHPDGRNLLVSPTCSTDSDNDGQVDGFDGNTFSAAGITVAYTLDPTDGDQRMNVTASTAAGTVGLFQDVYGVLAGEVVTFSADSRIAAGATVVARLIAQALDANNAVLGQSGAATSTNSSYTRLVCSALTIPAGTAKVRCYIEVNVPTIGNTGSAYHKNVLLSRTGSSTFVDNPSVSSYLLDPRMTRSAISLEPAAAQEPDGTRRVTLLLRNPSSPYDGY